MKYALIGGGFLVVSTVVPGIGASFIHNAIKLYIRKKRVEKNKFLRDLKRLQDRKLIDYKQLPDNKIEIILTKYGEQKMLIYNPEKIDIRQKNWDGKWRMTIFDIPEYKKQARDTLAKKLKELNFYPIQKSVFITPYPCEDAVDFLCAVFEISRSNVLLFELNKFEGEKKLRHHFNI